jgi:hypothetical protein
VQKEDRDDGCFNYWSGEGHSVMALGRLLHSKDDDDSLQHYKYVPSNKCNGDKRVRTGFRFRNCFEMPPPGSSMQHAKRGLSLGFSRMGQASPQSFRPPSKNAILETRDDGHDYFGKWVV